MVLYAATGSERIVASNIEWKARGGGGVEVKHHFLEFETTVCCSAENLTFLCFHKFRCKCA